MTPTHFLAAALALVAALASPVSLAPDRYKEKNAEATDPAEATAGDVERPKRAYGSWSDYEQFTKWRPSLVQLSRPYFIPVYGSPGKRLIYFPPQKIHYNPGVPPSNPFPVYNRPFTGPSYLPPTMEKTPTTTTTMTFKNRNFGTDDDDDRPIWGNAPSTSQAKEVAVVPTRAPRPSGMTQFPPLVHDVQSADTNSIVAQQSPNFDARSTTPRPAGPSNCVWAIVSCCSASSSSAPDSCFEQRGCPGPFWGSSPCDSEFAKAAVESALNYYNP